MAFTSSCVWEVETAGSDTANGGGFDTGVSGFPTDGAATAANTASPVFTSASYSFVAGDVGAWVFIKSGTNWTPGWYQIASVSGGAATLSAAAGAAVLAVSGQPKGPSASAGCATTAGPTGATWGIDYSQQASPQVSFTDMVIGSTTTQFTSAANPVGKNLVGNVIAVTSGTGFTVQRVVITSTSGTTATCDKSLGTASSTGGSGGLGGALATPGKATGLGVASNYYAIKNGTYSQTSGSSNVAGGYLAPPGGSGMGAITKVVGYGTVRGDGAARPVQRLALAAFMTSVASYTRVENLEFDGNGFGGFALVNCGSQQQIVRCRARNTSGTGTNFSASGSAQFIACESIGASPGFSLQNGASAFACEAHGGTGNAFSVSSTASVVGCIAWGLSTAGSIGFNIAGAQAVGCTAFNVNGDGFKDTYTIAGTLFVNCLSYGNGGWGFNSTNSNDAQILFNCAGGGNTSGNVHANILHTDSFVTLSGNPFTNSAATTPDLSLNGTAGAGAACAQAGIPGTFPSGGTNAKTNIGAAQAGGTGGSGTAATRAYGFAG